MPSRRCTTQSVGVTQPQPSSHSTTPIGTSKTQSLGQNPFRREPKWKNVELVKVSYKYKEI